MAASKKNSSEKRRGGNGNGAGSRASGASAATEKKSSKNGNTAHADADKFNSTTRPLLLLVFLAAGAVLFAALLLFDINQDFLFSDDLLKDFAVTSPLADENPMGRIGATVAVLAFNFLGLAAFMLPVFCFLFAYYMARFRADISLPWKAFLMIVALCSGAALLDIFPKELVGFNPEVSESAYMPSRGGPGGALGKFLFGEIFKPVIGTAGSAVLLLCLYFFCVLGLIVSAPQKTIANIVVAVVEALKNYCENRRRARELRARRREEQKKALRDAQEQLERNKEALENSAPAAPAEIAPAPESVPENDVPADAADADKNDEPAAAEVESDEQPDGVPVPFDGAETDDDDFSNVPVDDAAIPVEDSTVFKEIEPAPAPEPEAESDEDNASAAGIATLTPIDFEAEDFGKNSGKTVGSGTLSGAEFDAENGDENGDATATETASAAAPEAESSSEKSSDAATPSVVPAPATASAGESGGNGAVANAGTFSVVPAETLERAEEADAEPSRGDYVFPPISLLAEPKPDTDDEEEDYEARGQIIINELASFKCPATLSSAHVGPTITRYEIKPGVGVRAERILNLQNNVAMALQAQSARLASVPEHGTIGVEVPNRKSKPVLIREVLESRVWHENKMEIPAVLGKDVTGKPVLIDLAKMPHGLIAGSSGSGKSVCLNGLITSILYHSSPEEVRLVMIDPKVVELKVYNDAPHMLIPVITDMKRAPGAIKWLIDEMERRYKLLEEAGVRNIVGYNAKIDKDRAEAKRQAELAAANASASAGTNADAAGTNVSDASVPASDAVPADLSVPRDEGVLDEWRGKKKMSYIVCIIDEFGDLMAQNAAEIETGVHRLTAKARAAGIHLLLATQRPDAKTVTGLIKANLGTRIALRVTSGTNSRIILDEVGAETLIGKGDMLVLGPGSPFPQRAQGVWVSEDEIEKIVAFLAEKNGKPKYAEDVSNAIDSYAAEEEEAKEGGGGGNGVADSRDELVGKAWDVIRTTKRASISNLQRKLGIGYNRAAKIMDILEEQGRVGPELGPNKPREIYE